MTRRPASAFAALSALVVAFQLALVLGAPWGALTWGGRFEGVLPPLMRLAAACSALLLTTSAAIVLARAGIWGPIWQRRSIPAAWGVVAYCAVGTVANAITPSAAERLMWLPVVVAMLACSWRVARG